MHAVCPDIKKSFLLLLPLLATVVANQNRLHYDDTYHRQCHHRRPSSMLHATRQAKNIKKAPGFVSGNMYV